MLPLVILGVALLIGLLVLLHAFARADAAALARGLRRTGMVAGILVGGLLIAWLAFTGRLGALLALGSVALPFLVGFRRSMRRAKAAHGPSPGQRSAVRTRYLRVELDHDSGAMDGEVTEGPFQGRRLDDLSLEELRVLLDSCRRDDSQSATVLEAYLDHRFPDWREAETAGNGGARASAGATAPGGMSREEAYEILGLEPGAPPEAVREAHRRLMRMMHPDRGGSSYLAARINQAKDVLLKT